MQQQTLSIIAGNEEPKSTPRVLFLGTEEAALSSPLTLTWSSDMHISKNCLAFSVFLPLSKRRKKNTAFQAGKRFLVLKPYNHFITLSSESPSTYTSVKSNPQQMLAVARDFLLHYFWTSPSKHWTNCTRKRSVPLWIFHLDSTTKSSTENRKVEKSVKNHFSIILLLSTTCSLVKHCRVILLQSEGEKTSALGNLFLETENLILLFS